MSSCHHDEEVDSLQNLNEGKSSFFEAITFKSLAKWGLLLILSVVVIVATVNMEDRLKDLSGQNLAESGRLSEEARALGREVETLKTTIAKLRRTVAPLALPATATVSPGAKGAPADIDNPNVVAEVHYAQKESLPLPVDFLRKDRHGKGIAEALYATPELRRQRAEFQRQRVAFLDSRPDFPQASLAKYNNAVDEAFGREGVAANERDWERLNAKFGLEKVRTELPMCVMVPGYNNNANFRIEYNLNSIFSQNYSNFRVVIVDDLSNDGSDEAYRAYFAFHRIDKGRYVYVENARRVTALQNIYVASMNHCPFDSIVVTIDADDEFIGRNVLKVFNWGYQTKKAGVLYSNYIQYNSDETLEYGFTKDYTEQQKKDNLYRTSKMKFSHVRSYRNQLLFKIEVRDLQDEGGEFFKVIYDLALWFPMMELSCGRVHKIDGEYHLLYNFATGMNDAFKGNDVLMPVVNAIRGRKKYACDQDFDARMGK